MNRVCLLLEGTYPYITGGVSSCAHQLISSIPEVDFKLVYIGSKKEIGQSFKYPIPNNVSSIKEIYLFDKGTLHNERPRSIGIKDEHLKLLKDSIIFKQGGSIKDMYNVFFHQTKRKYDPSDVFFSKEVWELLKESYEDEFKHTTPTSFIDFFYNWRFSVLPIFKILDFELPQADIYHSLCTGYAGLLGCCAKYNDMGRFILTEHGIYTHERKIEISQSQWIYSGKEDYTARKKMSFFKQWWLDRFIQMGNEAYKNADTITTLYLGNKEKQIQLNADEEKIEIIANGIKTNSKKANKENFYQKKNKLTVALVGRVVPVKDIKTFIKSAKHYQHLDVEILILGPYDEDPEYFEECITICKVLELSDKIEFVGKVNLENYYPAIDLMVLSSITEGQPLVILEAFAHKIPVISTDVGSCAELVYGKDTADRLIGHAGVIVPFGSSQKLGQATREVLEDEESRQVMGKNAFNRFKRYYQEEDSINKYKELYNKYLVEEL